MKTRFVCGLITLLGALALQSTAYATFHLNQIEQVILSVDGDTTAQAIQLRMRAAGQNFVSGGKLVVFDAAGLNPITVVDPVTNVVNGAVGDHVLIASATFPGHTTPMAVPDFTMANLIPASYFAAGSLCWESDAGVVMWRLSWGGASYTGSNLGSTFNIWTATSVRRSAAQFPRPVPSRYNSREAPLILAPTMPPIISSLEARSCFLIMLAPASLSSRRCLPPLSTVSMGAPEPAESFPQPIRVNRVRVEIFSNLGKGT